MSRYIRGDVVLADIPFMNEDGYFKSKIRPMVVIDVLDESDNITVVCSSKIDKASKFASIVVSKDSPEAKSMRLFENTLIYCNETITLSNGEIIRRIGTCPLVKEICKKLGYEYRDDV